MSHIWPAHARQRNWAALLVAGALFMEYLNATIVTNALPAIGRSLGVGVTTLSWSVTAYLLALGVLIPASGWMADRFGGRACFVVAVSVFTLASVACAGCSSLPAFIAWRVVQGGAAAFMTPVGRLVVLRGCAKHELVHLVACLTWPALIAPAIAPLLSGLIVEHASWRWIFLINLPVGLAGAVAGWFLLPAQRDAAPRLDGAGLAIWACLAVAIMLGAGEARHLGRLLSGVIWLTAALAALALWRHLKRRALPILDLSVLEFAALRYACLSGSAIRMAILAMPYLLPLFLQEALHLTPARAGWVLLIGMMANIGTKFLTTPLLRRYSYRAVLVVNGGVLAMGFAAFATVGVAQSWLLVLMIATGIGRSVQFTALNTMAFRDVPPGRMSAATTVLATVQQMNGALGISLVALAIEIGPGYAGAFVLCAVLCGMGSLAGLGLPRGMMAGTR